MPTCKGFILVHETDAVGSKDYSYTKLVNIQYIQYISTFKDVPCCIFFKNGPSMDVHESFEELISLIQDA